MNDKISEHQRVLQFYGKIWGLTDFGTPIETLNSVIYPVSHHNHPAMLKLPKPGSDEREAWKILDYYQGEGAVQLLGYDEEALLLERADDTISLTKMVESGKDDEATEIIAGVINQLHVRRVEAPPQNAVPLDRRFRALFRRADLDKTSNPSSIHIKAARIARDLLAQPQEVRVLHGDIHHGNILHDSKRGWLAIDPKGVLGERTYDAANLFCNPHTLPALVQDKKRMSHQAEILATLLGLDPRRLLSFAFAHACLSACWSEEDGHDPSLARGCAQVLGELVG